MDLKKLSEPLHIDSIDFRVQSINKGGYATILAYKDARVDMNRLDEVCGANKWQRDHKIIGDTLYCGIAIDVSNEGHIPQWVWKWDVGVESYSDKEKGQASDAFKRAGFNWGIGRELYEYPIIQIKLKSDEFSTDGGKVKQTYNLKIKSWKWDSEFKDGKIVRLSCVDQNGDERYNWNLESGERKIASPKAKSTPKQPQKPWLNPNTKEWDNAVSKKVPIEKVKNHYSISKENEAKYLEAIK